MVGKVFDKAVNFLVDTGSAVTLVSVSVVKQLDKDDFEVVDVPFDIYLADGQKLEVEGQALLEITLGPMKVEHPVIIADIKQQAILGMDFMAKQECKLDLHHLVMKVQGKEVAMWNEDKSNPQCCRISVPYDMVIPALHEKVISGRVIRKGNESNLNLIEGTNLFIERTGLFVARSLACISSGNVLVRMCNPNTTDIELHQGTTIAIGEPVEVCSTQDQSLCSITTEPSVCSGTQTGERTKFPEHLQDVLDRGSVHLTETEKELLKQKLAQYADVISLKDETLGRTNVTRHRIDTGTEAPIHQKLRRVPMHLQDEVDTAMQDMIDKDVIEPSSSPWQSNVVLVRKKDGSLRFCIDYRPLNKITVKDSYRLPSIAESLDLLSGASLFSCLDLASGYWQVEMDPDDKEKTAFATSRHGLYQFKVMPFGLCNAPSTLENVLSGLQFETLLVYLDDIIIPCKDFEQGLQRLEMVFQRLRQAGLKLKGKKCFLFQKEVIYLGHKVSKQGIQTDPAKISAVKDWPTPENVHEVRSFMGLCSYYRKFIEHFAEIARPLNKLTEKNARFLWSDKCDQSFKELKEHLITAPILAYPSLDHKFILDTDASNDSIGAVLSQIIDGRECVIAYGSKALLKAERNYCVTRRELLAAVFFMKQYKHYLYGKKFLLRTDHGALKWLFRFKDPSGQIARWLETLSMFDFDIEHRPGRQHGNADGLSRVPCRQCGMGGSNLVQVLTRSQASRSQQDEPCKAQTDGNGVAESHQDQQQNCWVSHFSHEQLRQYQLDDPVIGKVLNMLETESTKPSWQEVSKECADFKAYWSLWEILVQKDGVLYKQWLNPIDKTSHLQLIVPLSLRDHLVQELHGVLTSGHLGRKKTTEKVKSWFYWVGWCADVRKFCETCPQCPKKKPSPRKPRTELKQYLTGEPLERVGLDILGPLPATYKGNRYILVVIDYFTKWAEAYPMRNQEAHTVADKLVYGLIARFGVPLQLHTDQGRQFESNLFQELCNLLGIAKTRTTSYHPQSDGLVERYNRTLQGMLSLFVEENQRDWDEYVAVLCMAYRASPQESTNVTPNMMMLGHEVNLPVDILYGQPVTDEHFESESEYVETLKKKLEAAHEFARQQLQRSACRQKRYYDLKVYGNPYQRGDFVWLYLPRRKVGLSPKLQTFWEGPYLIVQKISDALYAVQRSKTSKKEVVHFDRLKPYKGTELESWLEPLSRTNDVRNFAYGATGSKTDRVRNSVDIRECWQNPEGDNDGEMSEAQGENLHGPGIEDWSDVHLRSHRETDSVDCREGGSSLNGDNDRKESEASDNHPLYPGIGNHSDNVDLTGHTSKLCRFISDSESDYEDESAIDRLPGQLEYCVIDSSRVSLDNYGRCGNGSVRQLPETPCVTDSIGNGPVRQLPEVPGDGIDLIQNDSVSEAPNESSTSCTYTVDSDLLESSNIDKSSDKFTNKSSGSDDISFVSDRREDARRSQRNRKPTKRLIEEI